MPFGGARAGARGAEDGLSEAQAHEVCLRLLAVRPRSRHELGQRLAGRGCTDEVAEGVLVRLEAVGLVDDAVFAQAWVQSRHTHAGKGRRALSTELRTKGVADDLVRTAVEQVDDEAEQARAVELVRRTLRRTPVPEDPAARAALTRRLVGMLGRRGYPSGTVRTVVAAELAAAGAVVDETG